MEINTESYKGEMELCLNGSQKLLDVAVTDKNLPGA